MYSLLNSNKHSQKMGGREGSHRENKNRRKASGTDIFYSSRHRYYLEIANLFYEKISTLVYFRAER